MVYGNGSGGSDWLSCNSFQYLCFYHQLLIRLYTRAFFEYAGILTLKDLKSTVGERSGGKEKKNNTKNRCRKTNASRDRNTIL